MEIIKRVIDMPSRASCIRLTPLGDIHLGAKGCDEAALQAKIDEIAADPNHYTILMGDMAECILPDDRRFDADEVAEWLWKPKNRSRLVDAQYERVHEMFAKIPKERNLGILRGNHENTIKYKHYRDLALDLSRNLGIPYLDEQAFIRLTFRRPPNKGGKYATRQLDIYAIHGSQSGRKAGGKINVIQDLGGFIDADIIMMGHVHDKIVSRDARIGLDRSANFIKRERIYVITGTYLKTYELGTAGYGARANYRPTAIGAVTLTIWPDKSTAHDRSGLVIEASV